MNYAPTPPHIGYLELQSKIVGVNDLGYLLIPAPEHVGEELIGNG